VAPRALDAVAALGDPLRRRLYELAGAQPEGITRDDAAQRAGVARHVAAYHLDQLAESGLLSVQRRRVNRRSGPGAGRPAKVYVRASGDIDVSLPPRNYRLAARVLLDAVSGDGDPVAAAARCGVEMGSRASSRSVDGLVALLRESGFEPVRDGGEVRLRNCAFHDLAARDRATVCAMNLGLMRGIATGMQLDGVTAAQQPSPPGCCVAFAVRDAR